MDNNYSENIKVCATCNFWMGDRHLNSTRTIVKCATGSDGNCLEGSLKKTHKMNSASCSKWERWSAIRFTNITSNRKNSTNKKKSKSGSIPRPVAIAILIIGIIINFILQNWMYALAVGVIIVPCIIICYIFYRKKEKPILKIIITIAIGVCLTIGAISTISKTITHNDIEKEKLTKQTMEQNLQIVKTTTVHNGYKPCFGNGNAFSSDYDKIAVLGILGYNPFGYYMVEIHNSNDQIIRLESNSINTYFLRTTGEKPSEHSIILRGIHFLTKIDNTNPIRYSLDDAIEYQYLQISNEGLNMWILSNAD